MYFVLCITLYGFRNTVTKFFAEPYRSRLKDIIYKIGYDYNIEIVELEIPKDHIHMVIKSEPKKCPSNIMQIIKSILACVFFKLYPEIKKKYFWGESCGRRVFCRDK
jgi:putative transposase